MRSAPFHAHIYYGDAERAQALALRSRFETMHEADGAPLMVGQMRDGRAGPHPISQYEIHFLESDLAVLAPILESAGLRVLIHPLTDDDLADHTGLGRWIGEPVELDLTVLDPPGQNQGVPRFGKRDF